MWSLGIASNSKPTLGSLPSKLQNQNRQYCLEVPDVSVVPEKCLQNIGQVFSPSKSGLDHTKNDTNTSESPISGSIHIEDYSSKNFSPRTSLSRDSMVEKHDSTVHISKQNEAEGGSSICNKKNNSLRRKTQNEHSKLSIQNFQEMMDINGEQDISINIMNSNIDTETSKSLSSADFMVDFEEQTPVLQVFNQTEELLRVMSCSPPKITCLRRDHQYSFSESEDSFVVFEDGCDQESEVDSSDDSNCDSASLTGIISCSPSKITYLRRDHMSYSPPKITCLRRDHQYSFSESEDSFVVFKDGCDQEPEVDSSDDSNCDSASLTGIISCSPSKITYLRRDRQYSFTESEDSFIVFEDESDQKLDYVSLDISNYDIDSKPEDSGSSLAMVIPSKKVRFPIDDDLCEIHPMIKWSFAYRSARKGPWEEYARDRDRFHKRIIQTGKILAPILDSFHRTNIFKQRYENDIHELENSVDI